MSDLFKGFPRMNKRVALYIIYLYLLTIGQYTCLALPGEVAVSLETSDDQIIWSDVSEGPYANPSSPLYFRARIVPVDGGDPSYSDDEAVSSTSLQLDVNVGLDASSDLSTWSDSTPDTYDISGNKQFWRANVRSITNDFVTVAPGSLSNPEVTISTSYKISKFEVTKGQWDTVYDYAYNTSPNKGTWDFSEGTGCLPDHPVTNVSWYDVVKWCNALSEMGGRTPVYTLTSDSSVYMSGQIDALTLDIDTANPGYRLPSGNEWEYAARGGEGTPEYDYSGSDTIGDVAIYYNNSTGSACIVSDSRGTYPVGSKDPNELGIFDMTGNVYELDGEIINTTNRNLRGGGFLSTEVYFLFFPATTAEPNREATLTSDNDIGFRIVQDLQVGTFQATMITTETIPNSSTRKPLKAKPSKILKK